MDFVGFLEGRTPDHRGRTLAMVFAFSDERVEQTHNYLQWLFPLAEPSGSVHGAPILSDLDIEDIKLSPAAQANSVKASGCFSEFLVCNQRWIAKYDHNQLRISRIIKSLRLLVGDDIALIGERAKSFWNRA